MRRWKRRARIVGPFLGVPLLLAALSLSVDVIEYRPQPPRERLSDRPIRMQPEAVKRSIEHIPDAAPTRTRHPAVKRDVPLGMNEPGDMDVVLPSPSVDAASLPIPTPPEAIRR